MSETEMNILLAVTMIIALLIPLAFYLLWGPHRFEKRDKETKQL